MKRTVVRFIALPLTLVLGGFLWSMSAVAQSVTLDMYSHDRTISVEGEVQRFIFRDSLAEIQVRPLDKNAAAGLPIGLWRVVWKPNIPLNRQGITERSLQRGDRVIVTGNPYKNAKDVMMLTSITRLTDGWRWLASGTADDAPPTPASVPKTSAQPESKPPGTQAQAGGDRTGSSDPRLATLEPNVRALVLEEAAAAKVTCEGTVTMMNLYECDCYGQETINRRLKAGTAVDRNSRDRLERFTKRPETLMTEMETMSECISTPKIENYGRQQAAKLQLRPSNAVTECAGRELAVRFRKQPRAHPEYLNSLLVQAMQFCRSNPQASAPNTPSTPAAPPQTAITASSNSTPKTSTQPGVIPPGTEPAVGENSTSDARRLAFAGRWAFVTRSGEASDPYTTGHRSDAGILTVELNGDMLTLGPMQTSYRVDGIERASSYRQSNNPADAVTTGTTMAAWDGARIVVEIRLKYPDNFRTVSARRVFSLTTDGGLLIETTGTLYLKNGPSQSLDGSTLYRRSTSATQSAKASPVSPLPSETPSPATPPPSGTPPSGKIATPPPGDTLGERQAKIQQEVADRTKALTEELRKQAQIELKSQPPSAETPGSAKQPCAEASPSQPTQTTVSVEFANVSGQPRKLYWIDFGGARQPYGVLQPGQRAPMQTYVAHRWVVTDMADACLATILISRDSRRLEVR